LKPILKNLDNGRAPFSPKAGSQGRATRSREIAFSLIEVMVACGIFFLVVFAILALVSNTLRNARSLRHVEVDAGMVASQLYKTNRLVEGTQSGDFGNSYPDYSWEMEAHEHDTYTNGMWEVNVVVRKRGLPKPIDEMTVWLFSPDSSALPFGGRR
jgi:hypothetical protein